MKKERKTKMEENVAAKITIGVCVMEKKVKCGSELFSAPMSQILDRLQAFGEFEVLNFGFSFGHQRNGNTLVSVGNFGRNLVKSRKKITVGIQV
ncbi:uncharacterized protein LOC143890317 isoform X2 [Tasmannia lanceolata]|uniref:uncharacterized protein LOC143890317 isoform X2 n=1 Tax=Tasmannia lanceolata TaxID=3420 RepID=UPI004063B060